MQSVNVAYEVCTWADVPGAIVAAEQAGAIGTAHLMRALHQGRIALLPLLPNTTSPTFKKFARATKARPAVVLIGDDDYQERGPAGWPISRRALRWARAILLHAAGADVAHYEDAIQAAQIVGRVLVIECSTNTLRDWQAAAAAAPDRPAIVVIAPTTGPHPVMPARERLQ